MKVQQSVTFALSLAGRWNPPPIDQKQIQIRVMEAVDPVSVDSHKRILNLLPDSKVRKRRLIVLDESDEEGEENREQMFDSVEFSSLVLILSDTSKTQMHSIPDIPIPAPTIAAPTSSSAHQIQSKRTKNRDGVQVLNPSDFFSTLKPEPFQRSQVSKVRRKPQQVHVHVDCLKFDEQNVKSLEESLDDLDDFEIMAATSAFEQQLSAQAKNVVIEATKSDSNPPIPPLKKSQKRHTKREQDEMEPTKKTESKVKIESKEQIESKEKIKLKSEISSNEAVDLKHKSPLKAEHGKKRKLRLEEQLLPTKEIPSISIAKTSTSPLALDSAKVLSESPITSQSAESKESQNSKTEAISQTKPSSQFHRFLNKDGPKNPGSKELPVGTPGCMEVWRMDDFVLILCVLIGGQGLTFVFTGELESTKREDAVDLVKRYGARVTSLPSSKTDFVVLGDTPGNSKLSLIQKHRLKTLNEDQLFDLVISRSRVTSDGGDDNLSDLKEKKLKISPSKLHSKEINSSTPSSIYSSQSTQPSIYSAKATAPSTVAIPTANSQNIDNQLWTDLYAPGALKDLIGNKSHVEVLMGWLDKWFVILCCLEINLVCAN